MGYYTYTYTASFTISPRLVASALVIGPIAYLMYVHQDLSRKTHHSTRSGTLTTSTTSTIDSIPRSSLEEGCHMFHDTASKSIPTAHLPAIDTNAMLTQYLRYNMSRFSRFPQAWIIYLMIPSAERGTFAKEHIQHLDFKEGDVVCGSYKVALRTAQKVEFAMKPIGSVNGRMVTSITQSGGDYIFSTETIMWTHPDKKSLMPLERGLVRWLHELTSWFLLDSGTKYLVQLGQRT